MRELAVGASRFMLWIVNAIVQLMLPFLVASLGFGAFLAFGAVGSAAARRFDERPGPVPTE